MGPQKHHGALFQHVSNCILRSKVFLFYVKKTIMEKHRKSIAMKVKICHWVLWTWNRIETAIRDQVSKFSFDSDVSLVFGLSYIGRIR